VSIVALPGWGLLQSFSEKHPFIGASWQASKLWHRENQYSMAQQS